MKDMSCNAGPSVFVAVAVVVVLIVTVTAIRTMLVTRVAVVMSMVVRRCMGMPVAVAMRLYGVLLVAMVQRVAAGGIGAVLWFKWRVHGVHDQVHGAQHIG